MGFLGIVRGVLGVGRLLPVSILCACASITGADDIRVSENRPSGLGGKSSGGASNQGGSAQGGEAQGGGVQSGGNGGAPGGTTGGGGSIAGGGTSAGSGGATGGGSGGISGGSGGATGGGSGGMSGGSGGATGGGSGGISGGSGGAAGGGTGGSGGTANGGSGGAPLPTCTSTQVDCDGNQANGCETDLNTSGQHCGSCARDCKGGACSAGVCQPVVLAPSAPGGSGIAVDATHLYWTVNSGGGSCKTKLYRCAKPDCATPEELGTGFDIAYGLTIDSTDVYWLDSKDISKTPKNGVCSLCTPPQGSSCAQLASYGGGAWMLISDETHVYWVDDFSGLFRVAKSGGTPELLDKDTGAFIVEPTTTKDRIFYGSLGGIRSCTKASACADTKTIVPTPANSDIAVLQGQLFWDNGSQILTCPEAGCGVPDVVAEVDSEIKAMAADDSGVYFATQSSGLFSCPLSGCNGAPKVLTNAALAPRESSLVLDGDYVYVAGYSKRFRIAK